MFGWNLQMPRSKRAPLGITVNTGLTDTPAVRADLTVIQLADGLEHHASGGIDRDQNIPCAIARGRRARDQIGVDPLDRITDMRGDLRRNDFEFFHLDMNDRMAAARACVAAKTRMSAPNPVGARALPQAVNLGLHHGGFGIVSGRHRGKGNDLCPRERGLRDSPNQASAGGDGAGPRLR